MVNLWRTYRAWRKEQRPLVPPAYVLVQVAPDPDSFVEGKLYRCFACHKLFVHHAAHCAYGYCQECS